MTPRKEIDSAANPEILEAKRRRRRAGKSKRRRSRSRSRSRSRDRRGKSRRRSRSRSMDETNQASVLDAASGSTPPLREGQRSNRNPYLNFLSSVKGQMPGRTAKQRMRELSARWRAMPQEEKQAYIHQAFKNPQNSEETAVQEDIHSDTADEMKVDEEDKPKRRRRRRSGSRGKSRGRGGKGTSRRRSRSRGRRSRSRSRSRSRKHH